MLANDQLCTGTTLPSSLIISARFRTAEYFAGGRSGMDFRAGFELSNCLVLKPCLGTATSSECACQKSSLSGVLEIFPTMLDPPSVCMSSKSEAWVDSDVTTKLSWPFSAFGALFGSVWYKKV